jgi:hypothetical protein
MYRESVFLLRPDDFGAVAVIPKPWCRHRGRKDDLRFLDLSAIDPQLPGDRVDLNDFCRNQHACFRVRRGTCVAVGPCAKATWVGVGGRIGSIGASRDSVWNRRGDSGVRP